MDEFITLAEGATLGGIVIPAGAQIRLAGSNIFYGGQKLELGLTTADVHDPTELPTYLAGYPTEEFRHAEIVPIILVDKDEDKYRTFNEAASFQPVRVKTTDDSYPDEIKVETSLTNYKVQPRRLGAFIPDTVRTQVSNPGYDVDYVHMARCARAINMDLEIDTIGPNGLLVNPSNWRSGWAVALASGYQWGGPSGIGVNSNPIRDLRARIAKSATRVTGWWMNQYVAGLFLDHPTTRDYTRFMMGDAALAQNIKAVAGAGESTIDFTILGLGTFHVAAAKWANPSSGDIEYLMPDVAVAVTNPPGVPTNGEQIATAYNFRRRGPAGNGFNTKQVRIEQRGVGGTLLIAEEASIPTMTSAIAGGLITGCSQ